MIKIRSRIKESLEQVYSPEEISSFTNVLCRDMLGINQTDFYLNKERLLSEEESEKLEDALIRLRKHEPVQYVLGQAHFYSRTFIVRPSTLIPRPETEELVDLIIRGNQSPRSVLDIGTGSGCIAVSLSLEFPEALVTGCDISRDALEVASENNRLLGGNVRFLQRDVLSDTDDEKYDVIVSNPPYVTNREKDDMELRVLDWEPGTALFVPDDDPLRFYNRIADVGLIQLNAGGRLYFEINRAYGKEITVMLKDKGYKYINLIKDLSGNDRIVSAVL